MISRELIIIVLLAIGALVCLIFFVFTLLEVLKQQINKKQNIVVLKVSFVVILLLLVVAVFGDLASTTTSFSCGKCHAVKKQYNSWKSGSHKNVSCADCHQESGITGSVSYKIKALNNIASWISFKKTDRLSDINNSTCLDCHQNNEIDNSKTINVRHKDFINQYKCSFCHSVTGHQLRKNRNISIMTECFRCHKSQSKSKNCSFCHIKKKAKKDIKRVTFHIKHGLADPSTCSVCHENKEFCIKCHKVEIPHPDFFGLQHSSVIRDKASEKLTSFMIEQGQSWQDFNKPIIKNNCLSCHKESFCKNCHKIDIPHPSNYLGVHMKEVYKLGKRATSSTALRKVYRAGRAGCFNCHIKNDCTLACHDRHTHPGKIREQWLR